MTGWCLTALEPAWLRSAQQPATDSAARSRPVPSPAHPAALPRSPAHRLALADAAGAVTVGDASPFTLLALRGQLGQQLCLLPVQGWVGSSGGGGTLLLLLLRCCVWRACGCSSGRVQAHRRRLAARQRVKARHPLVVGGRRRGRALRRRSVDVGDCGDPADA